MKKHKNIFAVTTEHVGGKEPWKVEVLNTKKEVISVNFFGSQKEMNAYIENVLQ